MGAVANRDEIHHIEIQRIAELLNDPLTQYDHAKREADLYRLWGHLLNRLQVDREIRSRVLEALRS
jgi:hypothetical protein